MGALSGTRASALLSDTEAFVLGFEISGHALRTISDKGFKTHARTHQNLDLDTIQSWLYANATNPPWRRSLLYTTSVGLLNQLQNVSALISYGDSRTTTPPQVF